MTRLSRRSAHDIRAVDRAATRIEEQSVILERHLAAEGRAEEQLRHLRHATGLITRSANDGVQAYRRASTAIRAETEREDADPDEVRRATEDLRTARARMLAALEVAARHYPAVAVDEPDDPVALPGSDPAAE
jgi:hypothetical protein